MSTDFQTRLLDPVKTKPYSPTDYKSVRQRLMDNTRNAFSQRFPIDNEQYTLGVEGLEYDKTVPTLKDEKKAVKANASLTTKLRGRWTLTNKETGEIKRSQPRILMNVPYMTRRGTFIRNGSEQSINYMFRLTPGVYARKKDNGMFEAHVNPKQGTGGQFKIEMDPKSGIFRVRKGTRGYKLYPLLKRAGVTDDQIKKSWGEDMLNTNREASDIPNPNQKFVGGVPKTASDASHYDELLEALTQSELDPVSTEITLGKRHAKVTPETLLDSSRKVLHLSQGKVKADYRDGLEFQKIDGPADYFAERIVRDGGGIARNMLWRASKNGSFDDIPTAPMNKHVDAIFNESRHASYIDGSSPFSGIDLSTKITRIGEGGIQGVRTAPSETRAVQDSFAGFIDPVRSVESLRVGLDLYLANGVRKGDDGRLYTKLLNAETGKEEWVDSLTAARSTVATAKEMNSKRKFVPAIRGSKGVGIVPKGDIKYYINDDTNMYSMGSNTVPGKNGIMSNRLQMGGKYGVQSMPLVNREAPLVRSRQGKGTTEGELGKLMGVNTAETGGRVAAIDADTITIIGEEGKKTYDLYDNHPFNQKGYLRSIPQVKVGDEIKKGKVLSTTNYTDDKGVAAQGVNLRTAFIAWKGLNFEDAIVVSETAARTKLAAEKMYKSRLPVSSNTDFNKKAFMGKFASKFTKEQMATIGDDGMAKPGTVLRYGDPMILAVRHNDPKPGSLGRKTKTALTQTWDHKYEGKVVSADKGEKHASVYTRANVPMQTGDKMSNRYAAKGVVNVVPDADMPIGADGKPLDVAANPLGIISRVNPMQVVETMAGKYARHTGKPEVIDSFSDVDMIELYEKKLEEAGLSATEDLYDPATGRKIPEVLTGDAFFYRMMHMAEDKGGARGIGSSTGEGTPLRGGAAGAKQMGGLHTSALVSHGAMEVIKDAKMIRGQANDDFWRDFRMGRMPKMPGKSLVNDKFYKHLQAAGINVDENSDRINFFGMTNEQARKLTKGHELTAARTYDQKTMSPIDGGMFDPKLFGAEGNEWGYIQLDEPLPNPVMEPAIASILNLTQKNFNEVMAGERELEGKTGGPAVKLALDKVDMKAAVKQSLLDLKNSKPSKKDKALKRYRFLKSMEEQDVEPKNFMMERIPVLPPKFRPVTQMDGTNMTADANIMYRAMMFARDDLRSSKERLPEDMIKSSRKNIYDTYKSLTGLHDPDDAKLQDKNVQGLLKWVFGKGSSKYGAYQRRVLGTAMNVAGRGVVTPNPAMPLDSIGIPIKQAWDVYEPFIVRDMVANGYKPTDAVRRVKERDPKALKHLESVVKERPVIMNRAPTLHRYGVMAFEPKLIKGNTIQVPPPVVGPYGMDFDGDTAVWYVPVSKAAVKEAREKMLPSKNLLSPRDMKAHYTPGQEFVQGIYLATRAGKGKPQKTFKTAQDAQKAYNAGEIDIDTPIVILENS